MTEPPLHIKLEKVRTVFRSFGDLGLRDDPKVILANLENTHPEFRSVAYEAVANAIACKDIENGTDLANWRAFMEGPGIPYIAQVHVGLGWAMAKNNVPYHQLGGIEFLMRSRVLDGCGYHDGIFRARYTLKTKKVPEGLSARQLAWYDIGLGRSIWFSGLGNIQRVADFVDSFPETRRFSLWQGIGLSAAFIGGCNEKLLKELLDVSGVYARQLAVGAAMAARGRYKAGYLTADTELACKCWWGMSAKQLADLTEELLPLMISEDIYDVWIQEIGERAAVQV